MKGICHLKDSMILTKIFIFITSIFSNGICSHVCGTSKELTNFKTAIDTYQAEKHKVITAQQNWHIGIVNDKKAWEALRSAQRNYRKMDVKDRSAAQFYMDSKKIKKNEIMPQKYLKR